MITEGRFQTFKNNSSAPFAQYSVTDTTKDTLGTRYMCSTDTEEKADLIARTLNRLRIIE